MNATTPVELREGCMIASQEGSVQRQMPSMERACTRKTLLGSSAYYPDNALCQCNLFQKMATGLSQSFDGVELEQATRFLLLQGLFHIELSESSAVER